MTGSAHVPVGAADPEALARLRADIEAGDYEIPAMAVADAIISFFDRADPEPPSDPATSEEP